MLYKMGIGNRIKQARTGKGWSQTQLADTLRISRAACSQWEREVSAPSISRMRELAHLLDVKFEWLATGRGSRVFADAPHKRRENSQDARFGHSAQEQHLLSRYSLLSPRERRVIDDLLWVMTHEKQTDRP
jgi:transcriptional regulator with XRE-family HTH domain